MAVIFEDNFSELAQLYAQHRPQYPAALFAYLATLAPGRDRVWDCGTGNGQSAIGLADYFQHVIASDASAEQIVHARPHARIEYRVAGFDRVEADSRSLDMVAVAQAIHWFDLDRFYAEVRRVLKPGGILAVWGYHLNEIAPEIDRVIRIYNDDVLGPYWSPRIQLLAQHYRTIDFPFEELTPPQWVMETNWGLNDLIGYLASWSGVPKYIEARGRHPFREIRSQLLEAWGPPDQLRPVHWPLYFRIGRV